MPRRSLVPVLLPALVLLGLSAGVVAFVRNRPVAPPPAPLAPASEDADPAATLPWCADGLEPIAGGGCFAGPGDARPGAPLILYLHGIYDRAGTSDEMDRQRRLALRASKKGFAVLAMRSHVGICHPDVPEFASKYCWPSNEQTADRAKELVLGWQAALDAADKRVGRGKRFVLGFSSGGYFAGLLASRGLFTADGFVIAHGGPVRPVHAEGAKPPLLLLSADDDEAQDTMLVLDQELTRENWAHDHYARDGGHGLTDSDIDLALAFFLRNGEKVPLQPPLSDHRPHPHPREAATGDDDRAPDELPSDDTVPDSTPDTALDSAADDDAGL